MKASLRLELSRAFLITGIILYIPANILPVMTMTITGDREPLTVIGGVEELYDSGLWPVAAVVFLASVFVPFLKLGCLCWILFGHGSRKLRLERTKAHQILHQIGTWSMIDIFLLAILAAVGQLGIMASVQAEAGAFFFSAMLICTILAADIYKTKMIWNEDMMETTK